MSPPPDHEALSGAVAPLGVGASPSHFAKPFESAEDVPRISLEALRAERPVPRCEGERAQRSTLSARLVAAQRTGDAGAWCEHAAELARALVASGTEFDRATGLARRVLEHGDDSGLRQELSDWYAELGEPGLAAAQLEPLESRETGEGLAALRRNMAVLRARTSDGPSVAALLRFAAADAPADPLVVELSAMVGAWAPQAVSARQASDLYLEAARRREPLGDVGGAFEDLLRAFEVAPASAQATDALVAALLERKRSGAADEVVREHARLSGESAAAVHMQRMRDAFREGDLPRALAAAFDAGLDGHVDAAWAAKAVELGDDVHRDQAPATFDVLLARAGLYELLAARIELASRFVTGAEQSRLLTALGHLAAGPLGDPDRATDAWIDAVVADPWSGEARIALRRHGTATRDYSGLAEALIRIGESEQPALQPARASALRELAVLAEHRLADPALASWAAQTLLGLEPDDEDMRASVSRLGPRVRLQDMALASNLAALATLRGPERLDRLRIVATSLRGRPDRHSLLIDVVAELADQTRDEWTWRLLLHRLLQRRALGEALEASWAAVLEDGRSPVLAERARAALAVSRFCRGASQEAIELLDATFAEPGAHRIAAATLLAIGGWLGRQDLRGLALAQLAEGVPSPSRAMLLSVASSLVLARGRRDAALLYAERACRADPTQVRPVAALAWALSAERTAHAAEVLERASGVLVPSVPLLRSLAETYEALGESTQALEWTRRWLALRPGDPEGMAALLRRAVATHDPVLLADALGWLFAQPVPLAPLSPRISAALCRLAEADANRGAALARRALELFGPRDRELRAAVVAVADTVADRGLSVALLERELAAGAPGDTRPELLLDLARRHRHAGGADAAARCLQRALAEGAPAQTVFSELEVSDGPTTSDGRLAWLEARAEALSVLGADLESAAAAWRQVGAARWDLAEDPAGAREAWARAALLAPRMGVVRLAADLVSFSGHAGAIAGLVELASARSSATRKADLLAAAAIVALDSGERRRALELVLEVLAVDPKRAELLAVVDDAASELDVDLLHRAYDRVAVATLGTFGERSVRYRAARQLERVGALSEAIHSAVRAFECDPSEGVSFVLMSRLAERTGRVDEVVRAIEAVAQRAPGAASRTTWLRRAAMTASHSVEGRRHRVDILLRALEVEPTAESLGALVEAVTELGAEVPEEREALEVRLGRAARGAADKLIGRDDVAEQELASVLFAALRTLGKLRAMEQAGPALRALLALPARGEAAEALAGLAGSAGLVDLVEPLLAAPACADEFIEAAAAAAGEEALPLPVARLAVDVAHGRGHQALATRLLVAMARQAPDDRELRQRAQTAVEGLGDPALTETLRGILPPEEHYAALEREALAAAQAGDARGQAAALQRALALGLGSGEERAGLVLRVVDALVAAGTVLEAQLLLRQELAGVAAQAPERRALVLRLTRLLSLDSDPTEAGELLRAELELHGDDPELLDELLHLARRAGDIPNAVHALRGLLRRGGETAAHLAWLVELATLLQRGPSPPQAMTVWADVLALVPAHPEALAALEHDARARGDWERLAELLRSRCDAAPDAGAAAEARRSLAALLDERLGRPVEARGVLDEALAAEGDSVLLLDAIATLDERLGARLRAGPLLMRASALAVDRESALAFALRACRTYLEAGDAAAAGRVLEGLAAFPRTEAVVRMHVEVARRSEDPRLLSEALDELATLSSEPPDARCAWLLEAARAALATGEPELARHQAVRAAALAPWRRDAQLMARLLEYQERGAGTPAEASSAVEALRSLSEASLEPVERELHSFLLAEALDVALPGGAGLEVLEGARAQIGVRPLVALGLAERLARGEHPEQALPYYEAAFDTDTRELRRPGPLALDAASLAWRLGRVEAALRWLELAAAHTETHARAVQLQAEVREAAAAAQVGSMPAAQVGSMPAAQVGSMPAAQVGSMPAGQVGSMPAAQVGSMPAAQVGSSPAAAPSMPAAAAPSVSPPQAGSTRTAPVQVPFAELAPVAREPEGSARLPERRSVRRDAPVRVSPMVAIGSRSRAPAVSRVPAEVPVVPASSPPRAAMPPAAAPRVGVDFRAPAIALGAREAPIVEVREVDADAPGEFASDPSVAPVGGGSPLAARDGHSAGSVVGEPSVVSELAGPRARVSERAAVGPPSPRRSDHRPVPTLRVGTMGTAPALGVGMLPPARVSERPSPTISIGPSRRPPSPAAQPPGVSSRPPPPAPGERSQSPAPAPRERSQAPVPPERSQAPALGSVPAPAGPAAPWHFPSSTPPPFPAATEAEGVLFAALERGSVEAGQELLARLQRQPSRTRDLVNVSRRLALALPGDQQVLETLRQAALADGNPDYAEAIGHVLGVFGPAGTTWGAPPLARQMEQPEQVHTMLFRDLRLPVTEALEIVWQGAQHLFRREPASYGVTGLERVPHGAPTPLGRCFGAAARALDLSRVPLFHRKSQHDETRIHVALLSPPALLLDGEVEGESPELSFHLGAMLAGTLPGYVLIFGAAEEQVRDIFTGLLLAFGPPRPRSGQAAKIAMMAEMLWESIPARSQRRLQTLCEDPGQIDYDLAAGVARQAIRRAGLFVSGDLGVAVRETCAEFGISTKALEAPGGLALLCASSAPVADLVRLATSQEYAASRWYRPRSSAAGLEPSRRDGPAKGR